MFDVKEIIFLVIALGLLGMPFVFAVLTSTKKKPDDPRKTETEPQ